MKVVCDWCLAPLKAPNHYNPLKVGVYCNIHCKQKDVLFKLWQNDEWLNYVAQRYKYIEGGDDETKDKAD